jgi:hypothetical protein
LYFLICITEIPTATMYQIASSGSCSVSSSTSTTGTHRSLISTTASNRTGVSSSSFHSRQSPEVYDASLISDNHDELSDASSKQTPQAFQFNQVVEDGGIPWPSVTSSSSFSTGGSSDGDCQEAPLQNNRSLSSEEDPFDSSSVDCCINGLVFPTDMASHTDDHDEEAEDEEDHCRGDNGNRLTLAPVESEPVVPGSGTTTKSNVPLLADLLSATSSSSSSSESESSHHGDKPSIANSSTTSSTQSLTSCHVVDDKDINCFLEGSFSWEQIEEMVKNQVSPVVDGILPVSLSEEDTQILDKVLCHLQKEYPYQNLTERVASVAFYHGLSFLQSLYTTKIHELQEQHEKQIKLLTTLHESQTNLDLEDRVQASRSVVKVSTRFQYGVPRAFHRAKPSQVRAGGEEEVLVNDHEENHTVVTALSTMSCRELSMQRYLRSRLLHRSSTPRKGNISAQQHKAENNDDEKNRIHELLEELRQAECRQRKLEQQLKQAGVVLAEDIPYQEAKDNVDRITKRMNEIGSCEVVREDPVMQKALREEYFRLEQDMEKYMTALMLTDEFIEEQKEMERRWEETNAPDNRMAWEQVLRHMPVNIRRMTTTDLQQKAGLSFTMAKKFQRTNVLQLLRRNPDTIVPWHPSILESLRVTGLTLTERRALHHHLRPVAQAWEEKGTSDPFTERKLQWIRMMTSNFKEALDHFQRHVTETDCETGRGHKCSLIGRQCPVRADWMMDYSGDLGYPTCGACVYEEEAQIANKPLPVTDDLSSSAASDKDMEQQQRNEERRAALKRHYQTQPNRLQQVSLAMGACASVDSLMDKMEGEQQQWILKQLHSDPNAGMEEVDPSGQRSVQAMTQSLLDLKRELLPLADRAGIPTTGAYKAFRDDDDESNDDPRGLVEVLLSEDLYQFAIEYMASMQERVDALTITQDRTGPGESPTKGELGRFQTSMVQLRQLLDLIHTRNIIAESVLRAESNHREVTSFPTFQRRRRKSRTEMMTDLWKTQSDMSSKAVSLSSAPEDENEQDLASALHDCSNATASSCLPNNKVPFQSARNDDNDKGRGFAKRNLLEEISTRTRSSQQEKVTTSDNAPLHTDGNKKSSGRSSGPPNNDTVKQSLLAAIAERRSESG